MKNKRKYRVIFLGDRRISWRALQLLSSEQFSKAFDVRVLVTNQDTYSRYVSLVKHAPIFINNDSRRTQEILSAINDEQIDLLLSVQYNWILPPEVLNSVNRLAFNLHNAKLPDYKGYNSISHAILNGDISYESTIHWMDDLVDSGDVAFIGHTPIHSNDTARSLYIRTIESAVSAFTSLLSRLSDEGEIPRIPLVKDKGVFYTKNSLSELSDITNVKDNNLLEVVVRAVFFPPYNVAYLKNGDLKYYLIPSHEFKDLTVFGNPVNQPEAE